MRSSPFLIPILLLTAVVSSHADSATWNLNPTSDDWTTAANWTPAMVPNDPAGIVGFGLSSITDVFCLAMIRTDGSTVTVGNNSFQVSYEGGDGSDRR